MPVSTDYPACTQCCPASTVTTPCCANAFPATLFLTISGTSAPCTCFGGTYSMVWDGVSKWVASSSNCGGSGIRFELDCEGTACSSFSLAVFCHGVNVGAFTPFSCTCSPVNLNFSTISLSDVTPCCGTFTTSMTAVVTE